MMRWWMIPIALLVIILIVALIRGAVFCLLGYCIIFA
jgi:hypothetical protein